MGSKTFYKWFKQPVKKEDTRVECTKDYFSEGDEYINEENGWLRIIETKLDIWVRDNETDNG